MKSRGFGWRSLRLCEKCVFPRVAKSDGVRLSDTEICDRVVMSFSGGGGWQPAAGWYPAWSAGKQPARSLTSCPTIADLDLILPQLAIERVAGDAEHRGGLGAIAAGNA